MADCLLQLSVIHRIGITEDRSFQDSWGRCAGAVYSPFVLGMAVETCRNSFHEEPRQPGDPASKLTVVSAHHHELPFPGRTDSPTRHVELGRSL